MDWPALVCTCADLILVRTTDLVNPSGIAANCTGLAESRAQRLGGGASALESQNRPNRVMTAAVSVGQTDSHFAADLEVRSSVANGG